MKKILIALLFILSAIISSAQNRIQHNGQNIFLNGMNLAWISFGNDLTAFNEAAYTTALDQISAAGGNCIRWWLHTNGTSSPYFTNDSVSRITDVEILAMYKALDIAYEHNIGVIMCLWSFDMLRSSNSTVVKNRNRLMLTDPIYMQAYINNALIPILETVGDHPAIVCWEIFNEPEGMTPVGNWSDVDDVPITAVQTFVNRTAGAIHRNTNGAKVSNGCWSFIAGSDVGSNTNYYSDARLFAQGGDPDGYLDFYMVHYYDWAGTSLSPFHHPASYWELDKPLVIGEFAANGPYTGISPKAAYDSLYKNGYAGALSWQYARNELGGLPAADTGISFLATSYPAEINIFYPVTEYNNYPVVVMEIPDTVVEMGSSFTEAYISLKEVFEDDEDSVFLTYSVSFNTNPGLITSSVDIDSNLILELSPGVSGLAEIHVKAADSKKKFAIDKFNVSVYDPDEPNLALLRKAWASSVESSLLPAGNAVDGSMTTRWSSEYTDNEWIAVDLGQEYAIECVALHWENAYGLEYEIQVATDTNNWQTVYYESAGNGGQDILLFAPVSCRYVRIVGMDRGTNWGFSMYELGVYEDSLNITSGINTSLSNSEDIVIYPVPFEEGFKILSHRGNNIYRVEIYTVNSTLIESYSYTSGVRETNMSIPYIQPGIYYVIIHTNSTVQVKKVLKL